MKNLNRKALMITGGIISIALVMVLTAKGVTMKQSRGVNAWSGNSIELAGVNAWS